MTPKVSIVIVNYRSADVLEHCLRSLHVGVSASCEIIVVDNDGDGPAREVLRSSGWHGHYFPQSRNIGYSAAAQFGAQHAHGEFLCFLHPDVILEASSLDRLIDWVEQHPRSVAGPRQRDQRGNVIPSARPYMTRRDVLGSADHQGYPWPHAWAGAMSWLAPALRLSSTNMRANDPVRVPMLTTSCVVMRRETWTEVGPFQSAITFVGVESEWFQRAADLGVTAWYIPTATIIHEQRHSFVRAEPAEIREQANRDRRWHAARLGVVAVVLLGMVIWLEHRLKPRNIA